MTWIVAEKQILQFSTRQQKIVMKATQRYDMTVS